MPCYVDDMRAKYGRLIMCHMVGDTDAELHAMADRIGVARRWFQGDHYDICLTKRAMAVAAGAVEITWRQAGMMIGRRRRTGRLPKGPDAAEGIRRANSITSMPLAGDMPGVPIRLPDTDLAGAG